MDYLPAGKSKITASRVHTTSRQLKKNTVSLSEFVFPDNRPETKAFASLQKVADEACRPVLSGVAGRKVVDSGSLPVQRFLGAEGSNQYNSVVPFELVPVFESKHVAENETEATGKTQARITNAATDPGGAMIVAGHIGNSLATKANWEEALNRNEDKVPGHDLNVMGQEDTDFDPHDYDDEGRMATSSSMTVPGWNVRLQEGELVSKLENLSVKVGGDYKVDALNVSLKIDHLTC